MSGGFVIIPELIQKPAMQYLWTSRFGAYRVSVSRQDPKIPFTSDEVIIFLEGMTSVVKIRDRRIFKGT